MGTVPTNTALQGFFFKDFKNAYIPNILDEVYRRQIYLPFLVGKTDLTIVEIGANIGLVSYYFKDFAKIVYAVEPSAIHLECLNKMVEFNKIDNIKVCPVAISNIDGKTKFYHSPNSTMFSLNDKVVDTGDYEEVETQTLETFIAQNKISYIDFLKLDCEGFEGQIIASDSFKRVVPRIKVILGEWHQWGSMSKELFANALTDLGFEVKWLSNTDASIFSAIKI